MTRDLRTVVVYGDAQAEAIALVMRSLPQIAEGNRIVYASDDGAAGIDAETAAACDLFFEQRSAKPLKPRLTIPKKAKRVRFPVLELHLLWPFCCPNPFNVPEPKFPVGRFPCADTFIMNCAEKGMRASAIRREYVPEQWPEAWPSLDRSFQMESARLSAQDAESDIKVGSFILKYFRKVRLFWAVNVPANRLLVEVIYRLIHAGFDEAERCQRADVEKTIALFGPRELLGGVSIPVHPLVAQHFALEWYSRDEALACPGDRELTFDQYTSELIDDIIRMRRRAAGSTPA